VSVCVCVCVCEVEEKGVCVCGEKISRGGEGRGRGEESCFETRRERGEVRAGRGSMRSRLTCFRCISQRVASGVRARAFV